MPLALQRTLKVLVEAGLAVSSFSEALDELYADNRSAENAQEALESFLDKRGCRELFLKQALESVYAPLAEDIMVRSLPGAVDVLNDLRKRYMLAIVSSGRLGCQLRKMEKAGIDSTFFSKIAVCEGKEKKGLYEAVCGELGVSPQKTLVCGDRIGRDLVPARGLGCTTVQMLWGRGLHSVHNKEYVDYAIRDLFELPPLIASWEKIL